MKDLSSTLFILNPASREGQARRLWNEARVAYPFLPKDPVDCSLIDIEKVILRQKPELIVIAGGDGTINMVGTIVAKMKKKPILSILPFGFGNALSYCLGVETTEKAIETLREQKEKVTIDVMRTSIKDHTLGIFNISAGFDARIVFHRENHRYIGVRSYVLSALRSFISHPEQEITLTIDKKVTLAAKASSLVIANCPVIGQNYLVSPDAKLNDGLLDCTLFSTNYAYITNLRLRGFKHPFYTELGKVRFKASHIRIEGEPFIQIDGDPVVHREGISIEVVPSQLTFLRNRADAIDQIGLPFN